MLINHFTRNTLNPDYPACPAEALAKAGKSCQKRSSKMNLAKFPRRRYTEGRTPIEKLSRLSAELAGPTIYMKRDDLLGLAGGGN